MRWHSVVNSLMMGAALALAGCGGGGGGGTSINVPAGNDTSRAPVPLVGLYRGSLYDYGQTTWINFALDSNGAAAGDVSFDGSSTGIHLTGSVAPSTLKLTLTGSGLTITGQFYGAYSHNSGSDYTTDGVHFKGTWTKSDQTHGKVDAWHESWPPYHHSATWYESSPDYYSTAPVSGVVLAATSVWSGYTIYDDETSSGSDSGSDSGGSGGSSGSDSGGGGSGGSGGGSDGGYSDGGSSGGYDGSWQDYSDGNLEDWTWTQEPYGSIDPPAVDGYDDYLNYRVKRHLRHVTFKRSRPTAHRSPTA